MMLQFFRRSGLFPAIMSKSVQSRRKAAPTIIFLPSSLSLLPCPGEAHERVAVVIDDTSPIYNSVLQDSGGQHTQSRTISQAKHLVFKGLYVSRVLHIENGVVNRTSAFDNRCVLQWSELPAGRRVGE